MNLRYFIKVDARKLRKQFIRSSSSCPSCTSFRACEEEPKKLFITKGCGIRQQTSIIRAHNNIIFAYLSLVSLYRVLLKFATIVLSFLSKSLVRSELSFALRVRGRACS